MENCLFCKEGVFKEDQVHVIVEGSREVMCKQCDKDAKWE